MEAVIGILIVAAAAYAISRWMKRQPDAIAPFRAAAGLAAGVVAGVAAGLVGGVVAGVIGGVSLGVTAGVAGGRWLAGKWPEWAEARQRHRDAAQFAEQKTGPLPYIRREPASDVSVPDVSRPAGTEAFTDPGPDRDSTPYTDPIDTTTEGTEPMATITSSTGGEVLTMDQLLRELNDIATDAASELEDAQADMKRAAENVTRFDNMVSSLEALDLDQATIADVGALSETAGQRAKAADLRASAADAQLAQAETALKGVQSRHSLMQEAHAATPHAADKSFYQA
jgi:hypothetical protein